MIFVIFYIKGTLVQFKILSSPPVSKDTKIKIRNYKTFMWFYTVVKFVFSCSKKDKLRVSENSI